VLQWQAQLLPQPPADAAGVLGAGAGDEADDSDGLASAGLLLSEAPLAGAGAGALPEPLKSVAYQPEPLSWKPAAVSCFLNAAAPQAGQTVRTGSEIFCKTSLLSPQDSHL
jgi:hypothetical protein